MLLLLSIAVVLPILSGLLLVSTLWPDRKAGASLFWCQWWLAIGVGFGIASFTLFSTLLLAGSVNFAFTLITEIVILVVLLGIRLYVKGSLISLPRANSFQENRPRVSSIVSIAFLFSLVAAIGIFSLRSLENPHGEPDAWYLWNSCARSIFRSGIFWKNTFALSNWSHPDYPLLIPANVVRIWSFIGKETLIAAPVLAFLFTFAMIGLLVSALAFLRGRTQAFIGGLILVSTPYFVKHGASQCADVPLGFYILAALVLINLQGEMLEHTANMVCLTGISIGLAAWTKNEGLLFFVCVLVAWSLVILVFETKTGHVRRKILCFIGGLLPVLVILGYFKIVIAPPNDLIASQDFRQTLARVTDLSRYIVTGKAFLRQFVEPYSLIYSTPIPLFFVYAIFLGIKPERLKKPGVITSLVTILLTFGGYFFIYITTPHDLLWHLRTSLSRLFLQLWPSIIFVALLIISSPEEHRQFCFHHKGTKNTK